MKRACSISLVTALLISLISVSCGSAATPPAAPTGLTCEAPSSSQIDLSWSPSSGADGYNIYCCNGTSCTPTSLVHTGTSTSWSDTGLNPDTTYRYRVTAYNENGESAYSATVGCATLGILPLDSDNDGVPDSIDNCPSTSNPDQSDNDADGAGNVCDNCPYIDNPEQVDSDNDGYGDLCDCGPEDPDMHPGATEICNYIDDDCDGEIDEWCSNISSIVGLGTADDRS